jgi:hypothetical protein
MARRGAAHYYSTLTGGPGLVKSAHDDVLDAILNYIKDNSTRISVCSVEPTTYNEAISTYKLAIKTISPTDFTGPEDGDTSGRKLTSNQHSGVYVDSSGDATHVALSDSVNSKLLLVTTCTQQTLTAGNSVDIPIWIGEISDPA